MTDRTASGRTIAGRAESKSSYCIGCDARITKGEPKASDSWPSALHFTEDTRDLLLQAAAEYAELCEEAGEYVDPVSFIDWVSVDALREGGVPHIVEHDGAPTIRRDLRHPFPLPTSEYVPRRGG